MPKNQSTPITASVAVRQYKKIHYKKEIHHERKFIIKGNWSLKKIQQIQKSILGRLGCQACCSGFRINFIPELDFAVDEKLNIRTVIGVRDEEA